MTRRSISARILERIHQTIRKYELLHRGQHVLLGVSGGADSVTLLSALRQLRDALEIRLTAAHLNHQIRGRDAAEDAAFVRALCEEWEIPCREGRADVRRRARRDGVSIEMAARAERYAFFSQTARECKADVAATGHTSDDQAETVLLKLTRGAGPAGLSGISPKARINGLQVVRPLLEVSREEVVAFLREQNLSWREDASNQDVSFLRNRIRHEVLPFLASRINPDIKNVLTRTASVMREEDLWLQTQTRDLLSKYISRGRSELSADHLKQQPLAIRRRLMRLWLVENGVSAEDVDFDAVERIDKLFESRGGSGYVDVGGGWRVRRQYGKAVLEHGDNVVPPRRFRASVPVPGELLLPEVGVRVVTSRGKKVLKDRNGPVGKLDGFASLDAAAMGRKSLFARSWTPGDRMRPLGLKGSKKLQDIFVDAKVPLEQRGRIPVFECGGSIVWVPGYRIASGWEAKDGHPSVCIRMEPL